MAVVITIAFWHVTDPMGWAGGREWTLKLSIWSGD